MPKISLVICLYKERDLLERLLHHVDGCFDNLVVVHDGPEQHANENRKRGSVNRIDLKSDTSHYASMPEVFVPSHRWPELAQDFSIPEESAKAAHFWKEKIGVPNQGSIHQMVTRMGGRFFEGPRCWQQEPHWPFVFGVAETDWILRLDADEYPSKDLVSWLHNFRLASEAVDVSGYTCIWPLWNGKRQMSNRWPTGRLFLFDRRSVRFFGMAEQIPLPDHELQPIPLILNHQPHRKSYGIRNILMRKQAYRWRRVIALSLLAPPTCLPRWRFSSLEWPEPWNQKRKKPLKVACQALACYPLAQLIGMLKAGHPPNLSACLNPCLHHALLQIAIWRARTAILQ